MPLRIWRKPLDAEGIKAPKAEISVIKDRCRGCGFCIEFCPQGVFEASEEINQKGVHPPKVVDETKCLLCYFCKSVCPDAAISVIEKGYEEEITCQ